jgi:hypothetical protein
MIGGAVEGELIEVSIGIRELCVRDCRCHGVRKGKVLVDCGTPSTSQDNVSMRLLLSQVEKASSLLVVSLPSRRKTIILLALL